MWDSLTLCREKQAVEPGKEMLSGIENTIAESLTNEYLQAHYQEVFKLTAEF